MTFQKVLVKVQVGEYDVHTAWRLAPGAKYLSNSWQSLVSVLQASLLPSALPPLVLVL